MRLNDGLTAGRDCWAARQRAIILQTTLAQRSIMMIKAAVHHDQSGV
jgi:hypothetical protein